MGDGYVFSKQFFLTYSWVLVECRYSHVFQNLVHIYSESWGCLQWSHACDQYLHNDQNGHWIRKIFFLLTLNSILVPTIIATPAKPILYNACKENRHGKDFCNSVAFVKYIFYERKGMQKIQRGMWHGFEVPTKTLGWRIWSWILTRSFGPFCSLEAGENAHNFFPGRAFIIPNSASFPTRNSFL